MRVLIADTEGPTRDRIHKILTKEGYEVACVSDGETALNMLAEERIPIVITTHLLPRQSGTTVVSRLRQDTVGGDTPYTYVIMLTGRSGAYNTHERDDILVDDYLFEPVNPELLIARVDVGRRLMELQLALEERNHILEETNERLNQDIEAAARVQRSMLPEEAPRVRELAAAWLMRPCEQLAGDLLNVFSLDEHKVGFYVLDVSGHGIAAALLAIQVSRVMTPIMNQGTLLKQALPEAPWYRIAPPSEVLGRLNRQFRMNSHQPQFFTMVYGIFDRRDRSVRWASAGHPGPMVIPASGEPTWYDATDPILCVKPDVIFTEHHLELHEGDRFYCYTDGMTEAFNKDKRFFDASGLRDSLVKSRSGNLQHSLESAVAAVVGWWHDRQLHDDCTILGFEVTG